MKKGMRSVVQTINLSNPKTCARPRPARKLVGENIADSRPPDLSPASNDCASEPAKIRICTPQDLQSTCEPKLDDRPEKPPPLSRGEKLRRAVTFLAKGVITAGLIYWTYLEGFWGDSGKTEDLYYRITSTIAPHLPGRPDADDLPHLKGMKCSVSEMYNHALVRSMDAIVGAPPKVYRKLRDLPLLLPSYDAIKETEMEQSDETDPANM